MNAVVELSTETAEILIRDLERSRAAAWAKAYAAEARVKELRNRLGGLEADLDFLRDPDTGRTRVVLICPICNVEPFFYPIKPFLPVASGRAAFGTLEPVSYRRPLLCDACYDAILLGNFPGAPA